MVESKGTDTWDAKMDTITEEEPEGTNGFSWYKLAFIILIPCSNFVYTM